MQVTASSNLLRKRSKTWIGKVLIQSWPAREDRSHARLAVANNAADHTEFFQDMDAKRLSLIDNQHHSRIISGGTQVIDQRETHFAFINVPIGKFELKQNALQQRTTRIDLTVTQLNDSEAAA